MWRQHLYNVCLQTGYDGLYPDAWLRSLNELESKVAEVGDNVRRVRRRRMEMAFKHDLKGVASSGPAISTGTATAAVAAVAVAAAAAAGMNCIDHGTGDASKSYGMGTTTLTATAPMMPPMERKTTDSLTHTLAAEVSNVSIASKVVMDPSQFAIPSLAPPSGILPVSAFTQAPPSFWALPNPATVFSTTIHVPDMHSNANMHPMPFEAEVLSPLTADTTDKDDFSIGFLDFGDDDLDGNPYLHDYDHDNDSQISEISGDKNMSSFMAKLIAYIQNQALPFHYIDVWVPACGVSNEQCVHMSVPRMNAHPVLRATRLIHAGDAARSDLAPMTRL